MWRLNEKYRQQNTITTLGRIIYLRVLQGQLATLSKLPYLQSIDINGQFLSVVELASDDEGLKAISSVMKRSPLKTIFNGDIKQP